MGPHALLGAGLEQNIGAHPNLALQRLQREGRPDCNTIHSRPVRFPPAIALIDTAAVSNLVAAVRDWSSGAVANGVNEQPERRGMVPAGII